MRNPSNLLSLVIDNLFASVIFLLILIFSSILSYKRIGWIQVIFNWLTNVISLKKEYVLFANFSKKEGNISLIKKKYQEPGCLYVINKYTKKFYEDGSIEEDKLKEIILKQRKSMEKARKRRKSSESLIYVGFPHVPLGFLDGNRYKDPDGAILYEYQGIDNEFMNKGFYELKKKYNTDLQLYNTLNKYKELNRVIALKIEQSFTISDEAIVNALGELQIISFGTNDVGQWKITNYAQIERYQTEFLSLLNELGAKGVEKIHLFATTPVSLSFSLGRVIQHYHPEIIVYNFNKNKFDWGINLANQQLVSLE